MSNHLSQKRRHDLEVAIAAAREAGATALRMQGSAKATRKADGSPVSEGDLAADAIIRHHLVRAFPDDGILSEEQADGPGRLAQRRLWIVDPIDGTRDYLDGSGEWAVQLALAEDGELVLGILDLPAEGVSLAGVPGHGGWIIRADGRTPLVIDPAGADGLVLSHSRRNADALERIKAALPEFRCLTATSVGVKVWRIISGTAGLYVHPRSIAEWDAAAPAAVLLAAGGTATDLAGGPLRFNTPSGRCAGLVFSKRSDHAAIITRMATAGLVLMP